MILSFADRVFPGVIPDRTIFMIGHLIGTLLEWLFGLTIGETKLSEVVNVETSEKTTLERSHKFLLLSPLTWGLWLTAALAWSLYRPPPKSWLELATEKQEEIQKSIVEASTKAKEKIAGNYVMCDWTNKDGKNCALVFLHMETIDHLKTIFVFSEKDQTKKSYPYRQLSTQDQSYVNKIIKTP